MIIRLSILFLFLNFSNLISQNNKELFNTGITQLALGNNYKSYATFKKLTALDPTNNSYKSYLSLTYVNMFFMRDSVTSQDVTNAINSATEVLELDSNNVINQLAYINALQLQIENTVSLKTKAKNLIVIKQKLDKVLLKDNLNADAYDLLGKWNATVSNFNTFEIETMKTFYGGAPSGATFEKALNMHKKANKIKPRIKYQYNLALTYKLMNASELYKLTLEKCLNTEAKCDEDKAFKQKCMTITKL